MYKWKAFLEHTNNEKRTPYDCELWDSIESHYGGRLLARLQDLKGPTALSYAEAGRLINSWARVEGWYAVCPDAVERLDRAGYRVILTGDEYRPLTSKEIQDKLREQLDEIEMREYYERISREQNLSPQDLLISVLSQKLREYQ